MATYHQIFSERSDKRSKIRYYLSNSAKPTGLGLRKSSVYKVKHGIDAPWRHTIPGS